MPQTLQHIDAIARARQRPVLYLEFHPRSREEQRAYDHQQDLQRHRILAWLDEQGFAWEECGPIANPQVLDSYRGQVCLNVPFDDSNPDYCRLRDFLEDSEGNMRQEGVRFCVMPLEYAMKNAAHDAPDFWTRWAEDF